MIYGFTIPTRKDFHMFGCGHSNGYIAVPKDHHWYGKDYKDIDADVHGGLTYSDQLNDEIRKIAIGELPETNDYWVVGFDTCHYGDNEHNCNLDYVLSEVESLKQQALEAI